MKFDDASKLLREILAEWSSDNVVRLSASLAYYSIFSLAPLVGVIVSIVALVFGNDAAREEISNELQGLLGPRANSVIQSALAAGSASTKTGIFAILTNFFVLLFGATSVFGELKSALNLIYGVTVRSDRPIRTIIRDKLLGFSLIIGIGFLLLVSLILSSLLTALSGYVSATVAIPAPFWSAADFLLSFMITGGLFAMIYSVVPDVVLTPIGVIFGGLLTALLFTVGKTLLAWYLGTAAIGSVFGAAGSILAVLVWVYYGAFILFFGAEFIKVYEKNFGHGIVPNSYAGTTSR
jgi:membrane protein